MLDSETVKGVEEMIDCIVTKDGNIQLRMNGEVANVLNKRMMFVDKEDVDRSFVYVVYSHDMQLDQVEAFLKQFGVRPVSDTCRALYQSLNESRDDIVSHIDDTEHLKMMAEGDYVYTLAMLEILHQCHSADLDDMMEYTRVYSLPKTFDKLSADLAIITSK